MSDSKKPAVASEQSLKQPKQLYMLFFAEMWERFSFYGMRALLILFMVKEFLYSDEHAYHIYAAYGALVYTTPFIGGILADRYLGYRKAVLWGGALMAVGHFVMAFPDLTPNTPEYKPLDEIFFLIALAFLIVGNGFFKPNISSIVGKLYTEGDPRRDAGFTIFYMGVNLGAFLAPLICGTVGELYGWGLGFGIAGIGMLAGLVVFWKGQDSLGDRGLPPSQERLDKKVGGAVRTESMIYIYSIFGVAVAAVLVRFHSIMSLGLYVFGGLIFVYLMTLCFTKFHKIERERMFVIMILLVFSAMFWAFFEQAGSSITLFTDRNVAKGSVPTSLFQSVNPLFILLFGPVFSAIWLSLGKRGKDLSVPTKFALGIFQLAMGFGAFVIGAKMASEDGMVSVLFLLLGYLLHTTGELCLSPVGLSMVTRLAPKAMISMILGAWYLSSAFAHNLGGLIAGFTSTSAYMEAAVDYKPALGTLGPDKFVYRAYVVEGEKDTLYTEPITVNIEVVEDESELKPNPNPEYFDLRRQVEAGESFKLYARFKQLDPFGDATELAITSQPQKGSISFENDTLVYTAAPDAEGKDSIIYTACDKEFPERCDKVRLYINIGAGDNKPLALLQVTPTYYLSQSTALARSEISIPVLHYVADAKNRDIHIEVLEKPDVQRALISEESAVLNAFVTPVKTNQIYARVFLYIMFFAFAASLLLFSLVPFLKKWMHEGVKDEDIDKAKAEEEA